MNAKLSAKQVPVFYADRKTLAGYVSTTTTSVGAGKLVNPAASAQLSRVNALGVYAWILSRQK